MGKKKSRFMISLNVVMAMNTVDRVVGSVCGQDHSNTLI